MPDRYSDMRNCFAVETQFCWSSSGFHKSEVMDGCLIVTVI